MHRILLKNGLCALQKRIRRSQHARKETEFLRLKRTRLGLEDFESLKVIGRGAFGEVKTFYIKLETVFQCAVVILRVQVLNSVKHYGILIIGTPAESCTWTFLIFDMTVFQYYFKVSGWYDLCCVLPPGSSGAEERHWSRVCHEDPAQS